MEVGKWLPSSNDLEKTKTEFWKGLRITGTRFMKTSVSGWIWKRAFFFFEKFSKSIDVFPNQVIDCPSSILAEDERFAFWRG